MKIEQLKCFAAVVTTGSYHKAADIVCKSQPALTKSIQQLEQQLGFLLFDRTHYRPTLTAKGERLFQSAEHCLSQFNKLHDFANYLQKNYEEQLTIAVDMAVPLTPIIRSLQPLFDEFPHTQFKWVTTSINGGNELLLNQQVDLAINEHLNQDAELESMYLSTELFLAVCTPQYHARHQVQMVTAHRIAECRQIIVTDSAISHKHSFGLIPGSQRWLVSDIYQKKTLILQHLGWGRLPAHLVNEDIEQQRLVQLNYPHLPVRHLSISAIRRQTIQHGPVAQRLWQLLNEFQGY